MRVADGTRTRDHRDHNPEHSMRRLRWFGSMPFWPPETALDWGGLGAVVARRVAIGQPEEGDAPQCCRFQAANTLGD